MDKSTVLKIAAASAAATAAALTFAQTDFLARKILDSKQLDAKRRAEYNYRWKTTIEKAYLQINYALAGGVSALHNKPSLIDEQTEVISDLQEMEDLVRRIVGNDSQFRCLKIDRDSQDSQGEIYLFLIEWSSKHIFRLPLMSFGAILARAFENQLTSTAMCFVADASSGQGSALLERLVLESKLGVAVVSEPLWMVQLARLIEANLYSSGKIETLFFGLCRMEAWFVRDQSKESKTVLIKMPGQSTTSSLLPVAQKSFPEDRHVFCYNGCQASVEWAKNISMRGGMSLRGVEFSLEKVLYGVCGDPVVHSVPLPSSSPLSKSVLKLVNWLRELPMEQAQVIESWMSSIDAFFKLKGEEDKNGYLPYVLRLDYLLDGGSYKDESNGYWALNSILQFITGSRSRQLSEGLLDAAREFMKDYNEKMAKRAGDYKMSTKDVKTLEECVFCHKQILLGNKTLQDTVQPRRHWTLKAASKRGGCACCDPEVDLEDEDQQDRGDSNAARIDISVTAGSKRKSNSPMGRSTAGSQRNYVDGRTQYAFDPTRFS